MAARRKAVSREGRASGGRSTSEARLLSPKVESKPDSLPTPNHQAAANPSAMNTIPRTRALRMETLLVAGAATIVLMIAPREGRNDRSRCPAFREGVGLDRAARSNSVDLAHERRRSDEHDDQRLDDDDDIGTNIGGPLHLERACTKGAEQQGRQHHSKRMRSPQQCKGDGVEAVVQESRGHAVRDSEEVG